MELDDLDKFLAGQQALIDMPDDDWPDYEAQLLARARKRIKLDKHTHMSESANMNVTSEPCDRRATGSMPSQSRNADQDNKGENHTSSHSSPTTSPSLVANSAHQVNRSNTATSDGGIQSGHGNQNKDLSQPICDIPRSSPPIGSKGPEGFSPEPVSSKIRYQRTHTPQEVDLLQPEHEERPTKRSPANAADPSPVASTSAVQAKSLNAPKSRKALTTVRKVSEMKSIERARKAAEDLARKNEEAKERKMTPTEYAAVLQKKFQAKLQSTPAERLPLKGKYIFYVGGDLNFASQTTRVRMDHITKHGGIVLPVYDADKVTHIITDASEKITLKALGLKSLKDIPQHVPTVRWTWLSLGNYNKWGSEVVHAAFAKRLNADPTKAPRNGKNKSSSNIFGGHDEVSRIEEFTPLRNAASKKADKLVERASSPLPNTIPQPIFRRANTDPLAEFYEEARRTDAEMSDDESDDANSPKRWVKKRYGQKGFTCDLRNVNNDECVNEDIIVKLEELKALHEAKPTKDDKWRAMSYSKAIRALRNYKERICSVEQAQAIQGVGLKTAQKIMEIINTGELRRIGYERTADVEAVQIFCGVYGVGSNIAYKWYNAGCRTLDDVKAGKGNIELTTVQKIGIEFYDDINSRMPRNEAQDIFDMIKPIALQIDPNLFIDIMGSFRRGKATCGDIDILITRNDADGKTHAGVLRKLLKELHMRKILTEDLAIPDDFNDLECTYRGLCRRDEKSPRRRIDILTVPYKCRGSALLYYTGDDIFNRAMRFKAGKMGYSLNQRGLFAGVVRDPKDRTKKWNAGTLVASETEQEIFKILGVPWQEPHERVRATS